MSRVLLDPGPLLRRAARDNRLTDTRWPDDDRATAARLADALGVHQRQIVRWRTGGRITLELADRCACTLGYHVLDIWPDAYQDVAREPTLLRCRACGRELTGAQRMWCSDRCWHRGNAKERMRRYRARHPEIRAKEVAYSRAYRQHAREARERRRGRGQEVA